MNELDADTLKTAYLGGSGIVASLLAWNGWRQGAARQGMALLAIGGAYAVGFFGRKTAMPAFSFLGYPEFVTEIIGGLSAGTLTYMAIHGSSRIFFKQTKEIDDRKQRIRSGAFGALLGLIFAALMFVLSYYAIRVTGTIASSQINAIQAGKASLNKPHIAAAPTREEPSIWIKGLVKLNDALNEGQTGEFLHKVDRVPPNVYAILFKLGIMVSSEEAVARFLSCPGISTLSKHPKLHTLTKDPFIAEMLAKKSYLRLLKNEKVVALANDSEFAAQIKAMDFEKALDHAIKGGSLPPLEKLTPQSAP